MVDIMTALTIKNIPDDLYNKIKTQAEQHHRSINSEVIVCLRDSVFPRKISPETRLADIRSLRSQIPSNSVTEDEIINVINKGRP